MKLRLRVIPIRVFDILVILILVALFSFSILVQTKARKVESGLNLLTIELVVPNLEPEVASSIQISDIIIDQNGKPMFQITEKVEKTTEHPIIDMEGNLIISKHPTLRSLFLKVKSVKPMQYNNGIKYNWQVVKIGGLLIWETKMARFVGLVRTINF